MSFGNVVSAAKDAASDEVVAASVYADTSKYFVSAKYAGSFDTSKYTVTFDTDKT